MEQLFETLKLLPPADARLNTVSREISGTDFRNGLVDKVGGVMLEMAMNQRADRLHNQPRLLGLAAPQIGAFIRMILWDSNAQAGQSDLDPEFKLMINPRLVRLGQHEELAPEACHSTGNIGAHVYRATSLTVSYIQGNREVAAVHVDDPFQARIIQHEVDHLNGIRCPDRIRSSKDLFVGGGENHFGWVQQVPVATWLDMKQGVS